MDIPKPDGPDLDRGTNIFIGCWVLTGFVFFILVFRYTVKAWVAWMLPSISRPERVWGPEDFFYAIGYGFDVAHIALIWKSHESGLGRHFYYLTPEEKVTAMKWDFISQPLAVTAAMLYRTGVIIFLYSCFAHNRRGLRIIVLTCLVVQLVANLFTILQIILQCGPNPYRLVNRVAYFHYMWDPLPSDGSVKCQSTIVQTTTGYVQGAFNSIIDFTLTYLAGVEIWQFLWRQSHGAQHLSLLDKFRRLEPQVRNQRLWQTALLCGPLLLSGVASIVKTYLLSALGDRADFTWNIVPFILWVKIEDYSIPIATTGPVLRLFVRTFIEHRAGGDHGYGTNNSRRGRSKNGAEVELTSSSKSRTAASALREDKGFVEMRDADDISENALEHHNNTGDGGSGSLHGSEKELVGGIRVRQEYEVRVEDGEKHTLRSRVL